MTEPRETAHASNDSLTAHSSRRSHEYDVRTGLIGLERGVVVGGPIEVQRPTGTPDRDHLIPAHVLHPSRFRAGPGRFGEWTSRNILSSSVCSATIRFNRAFSSSSCFRFFTSGMASLASRGVPASGEDFLRSSRIPAMVSRLSFLSDAIRFNRVTWSASYRRWSFSERSGTMRPSFSQSRSVDAETPARRAASATR